MSQINLAPVNELKLIEYPGIVKNVETMIESLGGYTKISQAICGEAKCLELKLHPKNPFNKAINGEINPMLGLLLSVKIRKSKMNSTCESQYRIGILGHCSGIFMFDSLCDFQYLPLSNNTTTGNLDFLLDSLIPRRITNTTYFSIHNIPLFCLPHSFARSDSIQYNIFRKETQEDKQSGILNVMQKSKCDNRDVITFGMSDAFPMRPDPHVVKRMKVKYVSDEQLEKVKKLFDECPIWTRIAILYESGVSNDKLKCIIPSLAYYFSTGPWRTLYVRYGYDPRRHFNSRYYQTFDFRLRFRSGVAEFVDKRQIAKKRKQEMSEDAHTIAQDVDYPYFEENKLPRSRQCILRYCDIRMRKIQEMLAKIPSPTTGAICNDRTGWLPVGFDGQIRQLLSDVIKNLMRKHCQEHQFAPELETFENAQDSDSSIHQIESELSDDITEHLRRGGIR